MTGPRAIQAAMTDTGCCTCFKAKAPLTCGICGGNLCKKCTQFVDEEAFSFLKKVPAELTRGTYCGNCHAEKVAPEQARYEELMNEARNIMVFMKKQGKETRLIKRYEPDVVVEECADEAETLLRLAFFAAQLKYNSIIDVEIVPKKVKQGQYQTTVYSGSGIPAHVSEAKLIKDRSLWSNPN